MVNKAKLYIVLTPAMVTPMAGAWLYFVVLGEGGGTAALYAGTKGFTLLWPVVGLFLIEGKRPRWNGIDWGRHLQALPLGVLTGGGIMLIMLGGYFLTPLGEMVKPFGPELRQRIAALGLLRWYVPFAVFLSVGHSLLEEYYWRWYVFGRARMLWRPWGAYAAGALSFAAHHYVELFATMAMGTALLLGTAVVAGGLLWCWMFDRQQTLAGAWVSHILVDAGMMIVGYDLIFG